ncbi:MAG TPA: hypothetical protein VHV78_03860 [Gemmatimonadaceae bacterium]|jgi:hypothetical protein|nr:hypothetical protein [Gemmatimonadaceae bacterium]
MLGWRLSDVDAFSATAGVENGAAAGVLAASVSGAGGRARALAAVAGGAFGYPIGVMYPHHVSYMVTQGDIEVSTVASLVGVAGASTFLVRPAHRRTRAEIFGTLSGGYLAGSLLGHELLARPFDFTQREAASSRITAVFGAMFGGILGEAATRQPSGIVAGASLGAVGGLAMSLENVPRAEARSGRSDASRRRGLDLSLEPLGAVATFAGAPGNHVLARVTF